jgi:hypothetical protein
MPFSFPIFLAWISAPGKVRGRLQREFSGKMGAEEKGVYATGSNSSNMPGLREFKFWPLIVFLSPLECIQEFCP